MSRWILLLVALFVFVACGSSDEPESAGDAMTAILEDAKDGRFDQTWERVHPTQQERIGRETFLGCAQDSTVAFNQAEILGQYDDTREGFGAVQTVSMEVSHDTFGLSFQHTHQLIEVDGEWHWVLTEEQMDTFAAGDCAFLWPRA